MIESQIRAAGWNALMREQFARKVRRKMGERHMTEEDLAYLSHVSHGTIGSIRRKLPISLDTITKVCRVLDISLDRIIGGTQ